MSGATYRGERQRKEEDANEGEKFYVLAKVRGSSTLDDSAGIEQLEVTNQQMLYGPQDRCARKDVELTHSIPKSDGSR